MLKQYLDLLCIEGKMTIKARLRYKVRLLSDLLILSVTFILVLNSQNGNPFLDSYGVSNDTSQFLIMIGFLFWQFGSLSLGFSTSLISSDASNGMLELKVQGKFSIIFLSFYKMFISIITDLFIVFAITLLFAVINTISMKEIYFIFLTVLINIPSILGMYGIGLLISYLTIKEKNVSSFVLIIQTLLIFVTNITSPLTNKSLLIIPYTSGVELTRNLYVYGSFDGKLFIFYIVVNTVWLL
ncbi:MAG: hypothetical protein RR531_06855, partial [Longicatena sp.]